jgi:hypothetical protein
VGFVSFLEKQLVKRSERGRDCGRGGARLQSSHNSTQVGFVSFLEKQLVKRRERV